MMLLWVDLLKLCLKWETISCFIEYLVLYQLRNSEGSVAGIRQKLNESLNAVAQYVSPAALSRESKKLDDLFESSGVRDTQDVTKSTS